MAHKFPTFRVFAADENGDVVRPVFSKTGGRVFTTQESAEKRAEEVSKTYGLVVEVVKANGRTVASYGKEQ